MAVRQTSYTRLESQFRIPYRSLANHLRKHLDFEEPSIKRALEEEAAIAYENRELGVRLAIERRMMLDFCIQMYFALLVSGESRAGNL